MTMPTSFPRRYPEVRFPADFTALYQGPFAYVPNGIGTVRGGNSAAGVSWPPNDGLQDMNDVWHKQKQEERIAQVRAGIQSRQRSRINAITGGHPNLALYQGMETIDSHGYSGGCGSCEGGSFGNEGAQVLAGRGRRMMGGVMRTLAGRQHVARRLTSRVGEFNAISQSNFQEPWASSGQPAGIPTETGNVVIELGEHLTALSDAMTSGVWDKDTTKEARGILNTLLQSGWAIPQNQITMVLRQVTNALSGIQRIAGTANLPAQGKDKNILKLIYLILERCRVVLEDLSSVSDRSPEERKLRLDALVPTLGKFTEAQRVARMPGSIRPGLGARGVRPPPLASGDTQYVFPNQPVAPVGWRGIAGMPGNIPLPEGYDMGNLFQ